MADRLLFDSTARFPPPKRPTESDFQFLNRAEGGAWEAARCLLEDWYGKYPDENGELRGRFRNASRSQHLGAWWELYTYSLFRRLGYEITVHPTLPGTTKNPDFLLVRDSVRIVVECAVMLDEDKWVDSDGVAWMLECIDEAKSSCFRIGVDFRVESTQRPKRESVIRAVEGWLLSLDADAVHEEWQQIGQAPSTDIRLGDWVITLTAYPIPPDRRAVGAHLIWRSPIKSGQLAHTQQMRKILSAKGSRYGQLEVPLVLALLAWPLTASEFDLINALFGSVVVTVKLEHDSDQSAELGRNGDGYWRPAPDLRGARISGVLLGESLSPARPFVSLPRLWINPWATMPLSGLAPFASFIVEDERLVLRDETMTAHDVFEHPPDWPHGPRAAGPFEWLRDQEADET